MAWVCSVHKINQIYQCIYMHLNTVGSEESSHILIQINGCLDLVLNYSVPIHVPCSLQECVQNY